jgi:cation:H+ antiporter
MSFISGTFITFVIGLALLILGAEFLVRGATRLAAALRISPLVVGLTVVAYGTSAAELAVCLRSVFTGQSALALGIVVGSNIFNVLFVLGLSASIRPLSLNRRLIRIDVPLMIAVSVLSYILAFEGVIHRWQGLVLFVGAVAYTTFIVLGARRERSQSWDVTEAPCLNTVQIRNTDQPHRTRPLTIQVVFVLAGLIMLVFGARYLVNGTVSAAKAAGVSEIVIGLTIVAAATSLPEAAASITATLRGKREIAVGNVVGSNICNLLLVLGATAMVAPTGIEVNASALRFDMPVMIAVALSCLPVFFIGNQIARWEGALFLGYYVAFIAYLIMRASHHDALPRFNAIMLVFVIPLTVITLMVLTLRTVRLNRSARGRA